MNNFNGKELELILIALNNIIEKGSVKDKLYVQQYNLQEKIIEMMNSQYNKEVII